MNLSIIITHYNKNKLLRAALDSAMIQLKKDDEIVVVDDCSKEIISLKHLEEIKEDYKNINFLVNKTNLGAAESKNIGIRIATNEIIVLLDADDTLPPNSLDLIRNEFKIRPEIDILYGNYYRNEMDNDSKELINCGIITNSDNSINPYVLVKKWPLLGTSPFRKSVFEELGGFNKLYPRTDDRDFYINAIISKYNFHYTDNHIYNWNRYSNGNNSQIPDIDSASSFFRNIVFYLKFSTRLRFTLVLCKNVLKIILFKIRTK
tara:strand:- start:408 stop:1193 length:786 start_codon:yes stop_codon:yes gene_type:complete